LLFAILNCGFIAQAWCKHSHPTATFFESVDENGVAIDRASPAYSAPLDNKTWITKPTRNDALTVKLQAWPAEVKNGETVTVLWSGLAEPQPDDIITFYCPFYESDVNRYLDYVKTGSCPGWERGYGHFELPIYNMREPCVFKLWRNVKNGLAFAASSNLVNFADGGASAPLHGHIALTNLPTQMRVMFTTGRLTQPPLVRYGRTKDLAMKETSHVTDTYTADEFCQSPANARGFYHPGYLHDFLLSNLQPNTLYYYSYGTERYMSDVANFTTPLPKGDPTPFKFVLYGDMGVSKYPQAGTTATLVRNDIDENKIKFVVHIGDISYARGWAYIWEKWFWLTAPVATLVPYMIGTGNHEYDHTDNGIGRDPSHTGTKDGWRPDGWWRSSVDSGGECGVAIARRYHMPDNGNGLFWYSYDYGMVHMIMISTEHNFSPNSTQYNWIEKDLAMVDRKLTPWVFIGGHRAMYASQKIQSDYVVAENMQRLFEDLLYKYKVDIAFWAHYHSYERTCKVYKNKCVQDGVIHIVVGSAGMGRDGEGWYPKEWSLFRRSAYGYNRITAVNATSLYYEWVENTHNTVEDKLWVHK